ncbi:MAG: DUF916 domain-containing protein [Bacteroidales bacterium]|nr:DUF916 domain-containing protein [Bacteroidales bacterium]MCF8455168.1 DUF916 domain-containing protein [Bacteroidales bacterium]
MRRIKITILGILTFVFASFQLFAQQFEVSPSKLRYMVEPGQSGTQRLSVINKSDVKKSYILELRDWTVDEKGEITYVESNPKRSCVDWVNISPAFFDLGPNESIKVAININVPDSGINTKWAMLVVREAVEQTSAVVADKSIKSGIVISPNIAIYILQSPASNTSLKGGISNLKEYFSSDEDSSRSVCAQVQNMGDQILDCKVYLTIMDLQTAEETKVEPVSFLVLPGVKHEVILELPKGLAAGSYSVAAILDYGNDSELEGVQMDIEIPEQKQPQ